MHLCFNYFLDSTAFCNTLIHLLKYLHGLEDIISVIRYLLELKTKKSQSLLLKKRVSRNNIDLNVNFPDSVFKGETIITHDSLDSRSREWWEENRVTPLTETEENIFSNRSLLFEIVITSYELDEVSWSL